MVMLTPTNHRAIHKEADIYRIKRIKKLLKAYEEHNKIKFIDEFNKSMNKDMNEKKASLESLEVSHNIVRGRA